MQDAYKDDVIVPLHECYFMKREHDRLRTLYTYLHEMVSGNIFPKKSTIRNGSVLCWQVNLILVWLIVVISMFFVEVNVAQLADVVEYPTCHDYLGCLLRVQAYFPVENMEPPFELPDSSFDDSSCCLVSSEINVGIYWKLVRVIGLLLFQPINTSRYYLNRIQEEKQFSTPS